MIETKSDWKVTIPVFGDSYELKDEPVLLESSEIIENYKKEFERLDLIDKIIRQDNCK